MTIEDAYRTMQAASGIKVGDRVRVLRRAGDREMGWFNYWNSHMDDTIGKEYTVTEVRPRTIGLSCDWFFPFFVLEKIFPTPRCGDVVEYCGTKYLVIEIAKDWMLCTVSGQITNVSAEELSRQYEDGTYRVIRNVFDEKQENDNGESRQAV